MVWDSHVVECGCRLLDMFEPERIYTGPLVAYRLLFVDGLLQRRGYPLEPTSSVRSIVRILELFDQAVDVWLNRLVWFFLVERARCERHGRCTAFADGCFLVPSPGKQGSGDPVIVSWGPGARNDG